MRKRWLEIIRVRGGRYAWILVEVDERRRRVLARSGRDWRSKGKAKDAGRDLFGEAEIIDATGEADTPVGLPTSSFELAPYALPLLFGPPPSEQLTHRGRRRGRGSRRGDRRDHHAPQGEEVAEVAVEPVSSSSGETVAADRKAKSPAATTSRSKRTRRVSGT